MSWFSECPFPIREIQTDNGTEFTKALISNDPNDKSLFESKLEEYQISYHRIRIATPRHNGKVERQHRIDQQWFYDRMRMFSLEDGRKQLAVYQKKSNDNKAEMMERFASNDAASNVSAHERIVSISRVWISSSFASFVDLRSDPLRFR